MPARLSVQLYTLRDEAGKSGLGGVIDRLGKIGYAGVEFAGLHDLDAKGFRQRVADAGMAVSSGHVQLPKPEDLSKLLDQQDAIGNKTLVVPFLPPASFADADNVRNNAERLNAFSEAAKARGMTLGYHNHWWEFSTKIGDETAHALLFRLLHPEVFAEIDVYWAKVGGADPARVVEQFATRAPLLHIKDGPADKPESPMTAVGDGVIDTKAIVNNSRAEWHIVELDQCATDMFTAVEKSHAYMTRNKLASGRS